MSVYGRVRMLDMQAAIGVVLVVAVEDGVELEVGLAEEEGGAPRTAISVLFRTRMNNRRSSMTPPRDSHGQTKYPWQCEDTAKYSRAKDPREVPTISWLPSTKVVQLVDVHVKTSECQIASYRLSRLYQPICWLLEHRPKLAKFETRPP